MNFLLGMRLHSFSLSLILVFFLYFFVCGEAILQDPNYLIGHDYSSLFGYIPKTLSIKTLIFKKAVQNIVYNSLPCLFFLNLGFLCMT